MNRVLFYLTLALMCFLCSCKKKEQMESIVELVEEELEINLSHHVDQIPFQTDQMIYISESGYQYSITKLNYYISNIRLIKHDSTCFLVKDYHYVDATVAETKRFSVKSIPTGGYIGLAFCIGLDSLKNQENYMEPSVESINMQWPEPMGGGYHFLKLEGYFIDSAKTYGYALHLGTNECLIYVTLFKNIQLDTHSRLSLNLEMNVSQWFKDPNTYDFVTDGNYIMGNDSAMKKVSENGSDVFALN